jgi:hypothetical protein
MKADILAITLILGALLNVEAMAQKGKPGSGTAPADGSGTCTALFRNTFDGFYGIVDEGKGIYSGGVDGTRCTINALSGSNPGDLLFTLNAVKGAKTTRAAVLWLDKPIGDSLNRGAWTITGTTSFHLKINELLQLVAVGQVVDHRASFHITYLGRNYKFRYNWMTDGGSTVPVRITRRKINEWTIESIPAAVDQHPHIARLWSGGGYGDGTVYEALGDYNTPFHLTIRTP